MTQSLNELTNLYIGDGSQSFSKSVNLLDSTAELVTAKNIAKYLNKKTTTAYTSLDDLGHCAWGIEFKQLLDASLNITYVKPAYTDSCDELTSNDHIKLLLENYSFVAGRSIVGLESFKKHYADDFLRLQSRRQTDGQQIWVVGCSHTVGVGISPTERYATLISNQLNLPCSLLAFSGSSIEWAADQIIRSDIRPNDIVFWGITSNGRLSYYTRERLVHVTSSTYDTEKKLNDRVPIGSLDNINMLYHNVRFVHQVINKCQSVGAQLFMLDITKNPILSTFLYGIDNYTQGIAYYENFIDFGRDGAHPGPEQHKIYAKKFLDMYYKNNE
jgi:hypothetical protein